MTHFSVSKAKPLLGHTSISGDKSISHRALMLSALANGTSRITNFLNGSDCLATLQILKQLHVDVHQVAPTEVKVKSSGQIQKPVTELSCQNSGTTIRLLTGMLAGQSFESTLTGSEQIRHRPMDRVVKPLKAMGANIALAKEDRFAPIYIKPCKKLSGKEFKLPIASAQVKSCLLLAGLFAEGETIVTTPGPARDHTERMLEAMGAPVVQTEHTTKVSRLVKPLNPLDIRVPGDISSAAFLIVAATLIPESEILLKDVGINPTRRGLIDALCQMGADIEMKALRESTGETYANIEVRAAQLSGQVFEKDIIVRMIDELPILALAASLAQGKTVVKDAGELRVKETNRIDTTVSELRKMGAKINSTPDGFEVEGVTKLTGTTLESHGDHRLSMMGVIAGLCAEGQTTMQNASVYKDSFPDFATCLNNLGVKIERN